MNHSQIRVHSDEGATRIIVQRSREMFSSDEDEDLQAAIAIGLLLRRRKKRRKRMRRCWVKPILQECVKQGEYHNLLQEMRLHDPESHFRYIRMSKETFDFILTKVCIALYMHACMCMCTCLMHAVLQLCRLAHCSKREVT